MQTVTHVTALRECIHGWRRMEGRIAFVPTMGNLHAGHLNLVRHARAIADRVVVSIFVNPKQFGENEDFRSYPSTLERDQSGLMDLDTDLLFMPTVEEIYRGGVERATQVIVPGLNDILEGECRPLHFDGVSTVVARLLNMVQPDVAVFGEKDFQQLLLVRRMVDELNMPVAIESVATAREADGLAMSSRNSYLSPAERALAPQLYQALQELAELLRQGERDIDGIEQAAMEQLRMAGFIPQYISVRSSIDLAVPERVRGELVVLAAALLGTTHLLDNIRLSIS